MQLNNKKISNRVNTKDNKEINLDKEYLKICGQKKRKPQVPTTN